LVDPKASIYHCRGLVLFRRFFPFNLKRWGLAFDDTITAALLPPVLNLSRILYPIWTVSWTLHFGSSWPWKVTATTKQRYRTEPSTPGALYLRLAWFWRHHRLSRGTFKPTFSLFIRIFRMLCYLNCTLTREYGTIGIPESTRPWRRQPVKLHPLHPLSPWPMNGLAFWTVHGMSILSIAMNLRWVHCTSWNSASTWGDEGFWSCVGKVEGLHLRGRVLVYLDLFERGVVLRDI
jgi:hypothetical protein